MIQVFNSAQKREVEKNLREQFGIDKIPGTIIKLGSEKLFLYTGEFSGREIVGIESTVFVEKVGVYFAKLLDGNVKLSIEGSQILGSQIKKNIFELDEEQAEKWMKGEELNLKSGMRGFVAMKYQNDFLGCGKASEEKISNFVPKIRRLKNRAAGV